MSFRIQGVASAGFSHLYDLSDADLRTHGVVRYVADAKPGFPDRIEMRDAEPGESLLLVNFEHLSVDSPYRSSHAIFVREGAVRQYDEVNTVPQVMACRLLSVRAFDANGMMQDAMLVDGIDAAKAFNELLAAETTEFLHVHNAIRGCYSGLVVRA
ncbi:DUF1203 domain-containing protein [Stakelama pacifica]|uniref:Uncharacterized protein DUF1203 n=1 Tax=Stakelama pacifica TaxID=517720 RepID=A0A4R6FQ83_9SPHN|nr:DUF1203 domain-containing protein [Stakelama pacifica]TDN83793.1 uncharacterized protein DUF1203 [Stakelama pacifica]GGO94842.1 hypothetical protein GCM10011329_17680 [Stakelama pacifica]